MASNHFHFSLITFGRDRDLRETVEGQQHLIEQLTKDIFDMAATLDELIEKVTAQTSVVDGIVTLTTELKKELTDALAAGQLDQAKLDDAFGKITANTDELSAALVAGTPNA